MKKSIKKIAAALSAAVMCALPMANALSANAAGSGQKKTFKTYITIKAGNKGLYEFEYDRRFNDTYKYSMTFQGYKNYVGTRSEFGHTVPQTGRSCLFIDSVSLDHFNGVAATELYDCSDLSVKASDFKPGSMYNKIIWACSNYHKGHWEYWDDFENNVTEEVVLLGDANNDGIINMPDATTVAMWVRGNKSIKVGNEKGDINLKAADVDGNGVVNDADAVLIQQYDLSLFDSFSEKQVDIIR